MATFEAKNTVKQGKNQKDKWYPFHACTGGGWGLKAFFWAGIEKLAEAVAIVIFWPQCNVVTKPDVFLNSEKSPRP